MRTRARTVAGFLGLVAFGVVVLLMLSPNAIASSAHVTVENYDFSPSHLEVTPGTTVNWVVSEGASTHDLTFNGTDYGTRGPGDGWSLTLNTQATYSYFCNIYPDLMKGTVKVTTHPASQTPQPTGTGTRTFTITDSPRPRPSSHTPTSKPTTASPTPTTASPTPTPTVTPTPTPTFTPEPSASGIGGETQAAGEKTGSSSNAQAIGAIVGVLALGLLGFLVYRRTVGRPNPPPPPPPMEP